jgi:hypothetical protein
MNINQLPESAAAILRAHVFVSGGD